MTENKEDKEKKNLSGQRGRAREGTHRLKVLQKARNQRNRNKPN